MSELIAVKVVPKKSREVLHCDLLLKEVVFSGRVEAMHSLDVYGRGDADVLVE